MGRGVREQVLPIISKKYYLSLIFGSTILLGWTRSSKAFSRQTHSFDPLKLAEAYLAMLDFSLVGID